jgi:hypothetical protein
LIAIVLLLVVVAGGDAAGRWRLWAVHRSGAQTGIAHDDAVLLVPVPALEVKAGDRVVIGQPGAGATLFRITGVTDSTNAKVNVVEANNQAQEVALPAKVWRVSDVLPYSGTPLRLLAGPVQAALLVLGGIGIIAQAERRRHATRALDGSDPSGRIGATPAARKVSAST